MKLLLCYLIWGYMPKWKIIRQVELSGMSDAGKTTAKGTRYYLQCEQTGWVKFKDCL